MGYFEEKNTYEKNGTSLLLSTLPDLPGKNYYPVGMVIAEKVVRNSGEAFDLPVLIKELQQQASAFRADAVIDIRVTRINRKHIIITGTAIQNM